MLKLKQTLTVLLAATFAAGLAGQAGAQNLDLDEMAAALVVPIITGGHAMQSPLMLPGDQVIPGAGDAVTLATITNGKSNSVLLKIDLVDGDPNKSSWNSTSFECELTGRETTTFVFTQTGAVYVECSIGNETDEDPQAFFTGFANGFMFVSVADPQSGIVLSQDVLFGDAIVVDVNNGQAYSFGAIPFQAGQGQNDGNKVYRFDNQEYSKFPAVLATNFITPVSGQIEAELILFTLDGTTGSSPPPRAKLGGFAYNDDEEAIDFQYEFDCFDIVALDDVNANIINIPGMPGLGLGTLSGHLELVSQPTSTSNDSHDDQYGDGNDTRIRPVHGWIVQSVNGTLVPAMQPIEALTAGVTGVAGPAAWGRPLAQSTTAAVPFQWDNDATLDADVRN